MTAYGRATLTHQVGRFTAEIQSLNRKHLEIQTSLPKDLQRYDHEVRKLLAQSIARGQVSLRLNAYYEHSAPSTAVPNLPLARQLAAAWKQIAKELNLPDNSLTLDLLADQPDILILSDEAADEKPYREAILEVVDAALKQLLEMRKREGEALQVDINNHFERLRKGINQIAKLAPNATAKYRQKLRERLEEILPGAIENEEKILREVCVFAEKVDIAEEIMRFNSHLDQCLKLIQTDAAHVGKNLEFLLQELGREINTIGSKSSDLEVSRLVVEAKGDIERIREQIQNVE